MKYIHLIIYIILLSGIFELALKCHRINKNINLFDYSYNNLYDTAIELQHIAAYHGAKYGGYNFIEEAPLHAIIQPEKLIIKLGEIYEARITLCTYDLLANPYIKIEGKNISVIDGKGKYSIKPTKAGKHDFAGEIFLNDRHYYFKSTYYVVVKE